MEVKQSEDEVETMEEKCFQKGCEEDAWLLCVISTLQQHEELG